MLFIFSEFLIHLKQFRHNLWFGNVFPAHTLLLQPHRPILTKRYERYILLL